MQGFLPLCYKITEITVFLGGETFFFEKRWYTIAKKKNANGDGTIRLRKDGRWELILSVGRDPGTGKLKRKSYYFDTQREAAQHRRKLSSQVDEGTYTEPSKLTVRGWLDIWQRDYIGDVKLSTKQKYEQMIRVHILPAMGGVKLSELAPPIVQNMYNEASRKGLSPKTVQCIHGVLHRALKQAAELDYIRSNPCDKCNVPRNKAEREIHPLEGDQIRAFLCAVEGDAFADLFFVDLFTGMREGEILGLTWDCIDFEQGCITIRRQLQRGRGKDSEFYFTPLKNGKTRRIVPAPEVMARLKAVRIKQSEARLRAGSAWENPEGLVFTNELGRYLHHTTVYRRFKKYVEAIGLPDRRFHDLRHTFATLSIQEGVPLKKVSSDLGHATAAFTADVYGHVTEAMDRDAANKMQALIKRTV